MQGIASETYHGAGIKIKLAKVTNKLTRQRNATKREGRMEEEDRFYVIRDDHFGVGIRWRTYGDFPLSISIAFPFFTFVIGIGKRR